MHDSTDDHRFAASSDRDLLLRQGGGRYSRSDAYLFRDDRFACEALGHVLQPCRDVDRVAERGEHHVIAIADVADDHFAAMNADAEADRFAQIVAQELIQLVDIGRYLRSRPKRLAARGLRIAGETEQRQLSIADELVGLTA